MSFPEGALRPRPPSRGWVVGASLTLFVVASSSEALDPARAITQYGHKTWRTEDGLPQSSVYALAQTRDGYLWLGTNEGLARFDGVRFTLYDTANTKALRQNQVSALVEDREGTLWIGTSGGGVTRMKAGVAMAWDLPPLSGEVVPALVEDRDGSMWIGTTGGLDRVKDGVLTKWSGGKDVPNPSVRSLAIGHDGSLWVGTIAGLYQIRDGRVQIFTSRDGLPGDNVRALFVDRRGVLWLGAIGGLGRFENGRFTVIGAEAGLRAPDVRSIFEDRHGTIWFGTQGGGLYRMIEGRLQAFTSAEGLTSDRVLAIQEDREGTLWVGTAGGGLNRFTEDSFVPWTMREGLSSNSVRTVLRGRDGSVWIGTDGQGLNRLKDGRVSVFTRREGLGTDTVLGLFEDVDGTLWIATDGGGLNRLKNGVLTAITTRDGLASNQVKTMFRDRSGALWVGTEGGLTRIDAGGVMKSWTAARDGLSNDDVRAIAEARDGSVWIGTESGLNVLKDGRITRVSPDRVKTLYFDERGTLWIGTQGHGLGRFRDGRLRFMGRAEGLFDDVVFQIIDDGEGRFWTTSNRGVARVSRQELDDVADGKLPRASAIAYGTADGMRAAECNSGSPGAAQAPDGSLWFATMGGATSLNPKRVIQNRVVPPVLIEEVLADGRLVDPNAGLSLPAGTSSLEVHYTALSLAVPERVRFQYRLDELDPDWVDAGTRRTAWYTNLPPGDHELRVIASNDDGVWNEEGARLAFRVEPHLRQRPWFQALMAMGVVGFAIGAHRLRVRNMVARETALVATVEARTHDLREEKERTEQALRDAQSSRAEAEAQRERAIEASRAKSSFLANMSHELRTPLNAILGFAQLMARDQTRSEKDRERLGIVLSSGEHLLGLINDVLSISRIEAGEMTLNAAPFRLSHLVETAAAMFRTRSEARGVELKTSLTGAPAFVRGDEGKLRQVLINLLGNAFKFTERGSVSLIASWREGRATFIVEDTGKGIAPEEMGVLFQPFGQTADGQAAREGTGLGLVISRKVARLMDGDITVRSEKGRGTAFTVDVALPMAEASEAAVHERRVSGLAPGQKKLKMLVVDDKAENRKLLAELLTHTGFEVREAEDGRLGFETWRSFRPDLVWMDLHMPGLDGSSATRLIREAENAEGASNAQPREGITRTVIVALSASALEHEDEGIVAAGCDAFLAKPFREASVFEMIERHLGVRFTYEAVSDVATAQETPAAERLRGLAEAVIEPLRSALLIGDDEAALRAIDAVAASDTGLAAELRARIKRLELGEILKDIERRTP
jgi:signal transduction histidine kinase/ligand-binding sensor domain-containing protein/CheY-like chemotaxis protein